MIEGIDHVIVGVPSLVDGLAWFEEMTGVAAVPGGRHEDLGTHNAIAGLGGDCYLELLAVDPRRDVRNQITSVLGALTGPVPFGWAVRCQGARATAERLRDRGLAAQVVSASRVDLDGNELAWEMVFVDHPFMQAIPFLIDWREAPSPAGSAPAGCSLLSVTPQSPDVAGVRDVLSALGLSTPVDAATIHGLRFAIGTPRGVVEVRA